MFAAFVALQLLAELGYSEVNGRVKIRFRTFCPDDLHMRQVEVDFAAKKACVVLAGNTNLYPSLENFRGVVFEMADFFVHVAF